MIFRYHSQKNTAKMNCKAKFSFLLFLFILQVRAELVPIKLGKEICDAFEFDEYSTYIVGIDGSKIDRTFRFSGHQMMQKCVIQEEKETTSILSNNNISISKYDFNRHFKKCRLQILPDNKLIYNVTDSTNFLNNITIDNENCFQYKDIVLKTTTETRPSVTGGDVIIVQSSSQIGKPSCHNSTYIRLKGGNDTYINTIPTRSLVDILPGNVNYTLFQCKNTLRITKAHSTFGRINCGKDNNTVILKDNSDQNIDIITNGNFVIVNENLTLINVSVLNVKVKNSYIVATKYGQLHKLNMNNNNNSILHIRQKGIGLRIRDSNVHIHAFVDQTISVYLPSNITLKNGNYTIKIATDISNLLDINFDNVTQASYYLFKDKSKITCNVGVICKIYVDNIEIQMWRWTGKKNPNNEQPVYRRYYYQKPVNCNKMNVTKRHVIQDNLNLFIQCIDKSEIVFSNSQDTNFLTVERDTERMKFISRSMMNQYNIRPNTTTYISFPNTSSNYIRLIGFNTGGEKKIKQMKVNDRRILIITEHLDNMEVSRTVIYYDNDDNFTNNMYILGYNQDWAIEILFKRYDDYSYRLVNLEVYDNLTYSEFIGIGKSGITNETMTVMKADLSDKTNFSGVYCYNIKNYMKTCIQDYHITTNKNESIFTPHDKVLYKKATLVIKDRNENQCLITNITKPTYIVINDGLFGEYRYSGYFWENPC